LAGKVYHYRFLKESFKRDLKGENIFRLKIF